MCMPKNCTNPWKKCGCLFANWVSLPTCTIYFLYRQFTLQLSKLQLLAKNPHASHGTVFCCKAVSFWKRSRAHVRRGEHQEPGFGWYLSRQVECAPSWAHPQPAKGQQGIPTLPALQPDPFPAELIQFTKAMSLIMIQLRGFLWQQIAWLSLLITQVCTIEQSHSTQTTGFQEK